MVEPSAKGTRTNSAWVPLIRLPSTQPPPPPHWPYIASRHAQHWPQAETDETITWSPGRRWFTSGPTSTTSPTASWPRTVPGFTSGRRPRRIWRSLPQMVVVSTRTIASVTSSITGSGTMSQEI